MRGMRKFNVLGECGVIDVSLGLVKKAVEDAIGTIVDATAEAMMSKFQERCEDKHIGARVSVEVVHDQTKFINVEFDGDVFIIKIEPEDDCVQVAQYHCEHIGLDEEQCKEVARMLDKQNSVL